MTIKAGPELDALITRAIGRSLDVYQDGECQACQRAYGFHPSTSTDDALEAADQVVGFDHERFQATRIELIAGYNEERDEVGWSCEFIDFEPGDDTDTPRPWRSVAIAHARTLPLAICAAILALKEKP